MSQSGGVGRPWGVSVLVYTRTGSGETLVLLHGLGSYRGAWDAVVPALAAEFDVVAVDLPGFGESPPLPAGAEPTPAALAAAVADLLDELGIDRPHLAGNSLGGWVALELARLRPAASVALLSPAGLWPASTPRYDRASLRATRWLCEHLERPLRTLVRFGVVRSLALAQIYGRPGRLTPEQARDAISAMARCPGFPPTERAMAHRHYRSTAPLGAPVTVAFGSRDRLLLPWQSRHVEQLPAGTRFAALPGCGHVPMSDDPAAVVALLATAAGRAASTME
jgi:pimeloyl-ACP methyl ester carboxylesterase